MNLLLKKIGIRFPETLDTDDKINFIKKINLTLL